MLMILVVDSPKATLRSKTSPRRSVYDMSFVSKWTAHSGSDVVVTLGVAMEREVQRMLGEGIRSPLPQQLV